MRAILLLSVVAGVCAIPCQADNCSPDAAASPLPSLPAIGHVNRVYNWLPVPIDPTTIVYILGYQDYVYYTDQDLQNLAILQNVQILADLVNQLVCGSAPPAPITGNGLSTMVMPGLTSTGTGKVPPRLAAANGALPSLAGSSQIVNGSQAIAGAPLSNGNSLFAGLSGDSLTTAVINGSSGSAQVVGEYDVGPNAQNLVAGDFNGDGNADLAVSDFGNLDTNAGGNIAIFLGKGDGTFTAGATVNAGATPVAMATADFNGDGKLDLAAANLTSGTLSVMLGNGDGTFQSPATYTATAIPESLVAADFNADGKIDIAIVDQGGSVAILLGNGDGTFKTGVSYPGGANSASYVSTTDLNGDGKLDLIIADQGDNAVSFLFGNGDGSFQAPVEYVTGATPQYFGLVPASNGTLLLAVDSLAGNVSAIPISSNGVAASPQLYPVGIPATGIAAIDMNGDGYPDMVAADGGISVLLRNPGAGFSAASKYTLESGSQAVTVAVGDLNGDGKPDVVAASMSAATYGGTVDVALNNGNGTFGTQNSYPMGGYPGGFEGTAGSGLVLGDFNADGKLDVAAGFQSAPGDSASVGGISVLLGNGDGTLLPAVNYAVGSFSVLSMVSGEFTGAGKLDLVAGVGTNYATPGALAFLQGNGDGTFQNAVMIPVGSPAGTPVALAAADVNGDGKLDLVVSVLDTNFNDSIVVLLGNGNGTFQPLAPIPTPVAGSPIALLDLNGDGILDLAVGDSDEAVYLLGKGGGTFQTAQYFSSGADIEAFAVTDWNSDGVAGLAIAQKHGTVMAMESGLNPKISGVQTLTTTSAAAGVTAVAPGSLATAFGTDLATTTANASTTTLPVTLGGTGVSILDGAGTVTPAPLVYVSPTQVNYLIPDAVATGSGSVTVTSGDGTQSSGQVNITSVAPALFTLNAANLAAADALCVSANGSQTEENVYQVMSDAVVAAPINLAACSQTVLELYATGMDRVSAGDVKATIGGAAGSVLYAGPQGAFIGLDQINVVIPQSLAGSGNVPIVLSAGGVTSNTVNVTLQ